MISQLYSSFRRPILVNRDISRMNPDNLRIIDIAANLTDAVYQGIYFDKSYHAPDLDSVLDRARETGVDKIFVTAGCLESSREALSLAEKHEWLYSTVGVHPTRCNEFDGKEREHLEGLMEVVQKGKESGNVIAIGECGLDYDRLEFCGKEIQKKYFAAQFLLVEKTRLPMFLHMRAAADDFLEIMEQNRSRFNGGVVHSFTGTREEAVALLSAFPSLYIGGINGCSLKTEANLETVASLPLDRLMIETDCPYCDIRNSHASKVHVLPEHQLRTVDKKKHDITSLIKGRNEPCNIRQVLDVLAALKQTDAKTLSEQLYGNTVALFFP